MIQIKQSTSLEVPFFAHDVNGDGVTGIADGSWTKRIKKAGGAWAAMTVTVSEGENGWYNLTLSTSHTDTQQFLAVSLSAAACKRVNLLFMVRARTTDDLAFPTTSGRSIDVSATGEVESNLTQIDGVANASATLNLTKLNIVNSGGDAVVMSSTGGNGTGLLISGNGSGEGLKATGGATGDGAEFIGGATSGAGIVASATSGNGATLTGGTNGSGIAVTGSGSGKGINATGGASGAGIAANGGANGSGILAVGGATSGAGLTAMASADGNGITAIGVGSGYNGIYSLAGTNGHGLALTGDGSGEGLKATGGATGHGIEATGGATSGVGIAAIGQAGHGFAATSTGGNGNGITATGNGTGEGLEARGGATGNGIEAIGGSTSGDAFRLTVTDGMKLNDADVSAAVATDAGNTALSFKTTLTQATDDFWNGAFLRITSGALKGQVKLISDYDGTTKIVTVTGGFTGVPADAVTFDIVNE